MSEAHITVGTCLTVTDGPFTTLQTTVTAVDTASAQVKGVVEMFGRRIPVYLSLAGPSHSPRVTAVPDRSDIIAAHAGATRHYGVVGRVVSGDDAGRYVRVDKLTELADDLDEFAEDTDEIAEADLTETDLTETDVAESGIAEIDEEGTESVPVIIRIADDPGMRINCVNECVEDWAAVEEAFQRDGRRVDWG